MSATSGQLPPTDLIRTELKSAIADDPRQLGDVYRAMQETGETTPTGLAELGVTGGSGPASKSLAILRAVLEGEVPTTPYLARDAQRTIRRLRGSNVFSSETDNYLDHLNQALAVVATDPVGAATEESELRAISSRLERRAEATAGIYVYTYPMYRLHPHDEERDLYVMKVGRSKDAENRTAVQGRSTAAPEPILHLFTYTDPQGRELSQLESRFHLLLDAAGHPRTGGHRRSEWFATSEEFLDAIALTLGMEKCED